jgi:alkylation response protein AidB-like acyl-CoA dehydrogenase
LWQLRHFVAFAAAGEPRIGSAGPSCYPIGMVMCDACILSVLNGATEIQAQVIGRGLWNSRTDD